MAKFYIESVSTMVRTVSFVGMIMGNMPIKIVSAFGMIAVNLVKVLYEWNKTRVDQKATQC